MRLLASGTKAILRVGYTTITGHSLVPDITREFRLANPDVRLELTYMTIPAQRDKILQDEIDLGFIEGSFQSSEIESRPVARHRLVALLPPGHPLAAKDDADDRGSRTRAAGHGHQCRMADASPHRRRRVPERRAGNERSDRRHRASPAFSGLVTAGVGITIFCGMPRFCGENAIAPRPIITEPPVIVETHLAWRRTSISMAMRRFIETSQKVGKAYMT